MNDVMWGSLKFITTLHSRARC